MSLRYLQKLDIINTYIATKAKLKFEGTFESYIVLAGAEGA